MHEKKFTIFGSHATKSAVERAAEFIFTDCGLLAVVGFLLARASFRRLKELQLEQ